MDQWSESTAREIMGSNSVRDSDFGGWGLTVNGV